MFCPSCGSQNSKEEDLRFCRSCGADLRTVSRAIKRSLPVRVASALDSYLENRYQQNLRNGILNLVAFVFLLVVGTAYLISGWTGFGLFMLVLSVISIVTGVWDIWIYKRNLPPVAKETNLSAGTRTQELSSAEMAIHVASVTETTTKQLTLPQRRSE